MTERPLLCTGSVVRAILAGRQTEDRRPMRPQPIGEPWPVAGISGIAYGSTGAVHRSPLGGPGDLLYVRERARVQGYLPHERVMELRYEADDAVREVSWPERIRPPRIGHCLANGCYREAARIWLRVERVWVERVQDITTEGIVSEGLSTTLREHDAVCDLLDQWVSLWSSLYPGSWERNDWVFGCRFSLASTTGRPASSSSPQHINQQETA